MQRAGFQLARIAVYNLLNSLQNRHVARLRQGGTQRSGEMPLNPDGPPLPTTSPSRVGQGLVLHSYSVAFHHHHSLMAQVSTLMACPISVQVIDGGQDLMTPRAWQRPVSNDEAYCRAAGRRRFNWGRQLRAELRQHQVLRLLRAGGTQASIARALQVSASTISRDVAALLAHGFPMRPYLY
jgi:DNA-binding CsgD family transcriptional regulator